MSTGDRGQFIERLSTAARRIAAGDYAVSDELDALAADPGAPPDLAALAETFTLMAVKVEAREFQLASAVEDLKEARRRLEALMRRLEAENRTLKANAEQLRIVVDHEESEREVAEIADSDYFQELMQKARDLRAAPGGPHATTRFLRRPRP